MGATLYAVLTASFPYEGDEAAVLTQLATNEPPRPVPAEVPSPVAAVLSRCLQTGCDERFPSARELGAALEDAMRACGLAATHADVAAVLHERMGTVAADRWAHLEASARACDALTVGPAPRAATFDVFGLPEAGQSRPAGDATGPTLRTPPRFAWGRALGVGVPASAIAIGLVAGLGARGASPVGSPAPSAAVSPAAPAQASTEVEGPPSAPTIEDAGAVQGVVSAIDAGESKQRGIPRRPARRPVPAGVPSATSDPFHGAIDWRK